MNSPQLAPCLTETTSERWKLAIPPLSPFCLQFPDGGGLWMKYAAVFHPARAASSIKSGIFLELKF